MPIKIIPRNYWARVIRASGIIQNAEGWKGSGEEAYWLARRSVDAEEEQQDLFTVSQIRELATAAQ